MEKNSLERAQASRIVQSIEAHEPSLASGLARRPQRIEFAPDVAIGLIDGVRDHTDYKNRLNYLPIRHLYRLLHFDEKYVFQWRLEHKLVQSLVFAHFCPGSVPSTCGLSTYISACGLKSLDLAEDLGRHYVKKALGSNAARDNRADAELALHAVRAGLVQPAPCLTAEKWIVQERLAIAEEYRVHSIERSVVPNLTFLRHSNRAIREERLAPNDFVAGLIERLPRALLANSICGWDVCRTEQGRLMLVEVNFAGFHPEVEAGFQCSGFFVREPWGPYLTACLLRFVEKEYGVAISHRAAPAEPAHVPVLYQWVSRWHTMLRISSLVGEFDETPGPEAAVYSDDPEGILLEKLFWETRTRLAKQVAFLD